MADSQSPAATAGPTTAEALWSSHQEALKVGRLIERHHAQLRQLVGSPPAGQVQARHDAVLSYREDLGRIHGILAALDANLRALDAAGTPPLP